MTLPTVQTDAEVQRQEVSAVIAVVSYAIEATAHLTLRQLRAQFRPVVADMTRWIGKDTRIRQPCDWHTFCKYLPESAEFYGGLSLLQARGELIAKHGIGTMVTEAAEGSSSTTMN